MSSQMLYRTFTRMPLCRGISSSGKKATPAQLTAYYQGLQWRPSLSSSGKRSLQLVGAAESGQSSIQPIITQEEVKLESASSDGDGFNDYVVWDSMTGRLAGSATIAFLLLQLPQIFLNFQNLKSGNATALFAVPWMKREVGAMVVQAVGVVSTWFVLLQLTIAGSMPSLAFTITATAVGLGLLLNFLNYNKQLSPHIWEIWEDVITVGGLPILPQVIWSTFDAILPPSLLPGIITVIMALSLVALRRLGKLPPVATRLLGAVSAWTATLLFMWAPVAQMWTNYLNPANIQGLSVFTVLLAMIGNGLLLPRALFTRDRMWIP